MRIVVVIRDRVLFVTRDCLPVNDFTGLPVNDQKLAIIFTGKKIKFTGNFGKFLFAQKIKKKEFVHSIFEKIIVLQYIYMYMSKLARFIEFTRILFLAAEFLCECTRQNSYNFVK